MGNYRFVFCSPETQHNIPQIFCECVSKYRKRKALLSKQDGEYRSVTWDEWFDRVQGTALGLQTLGVSKGDRIGIWAENRPEWTYADLSALGLGAVVVPLYTTSSYGDSKYILENAGIEILFVSPVIPFERLKRMIDDVPTIKWIVLFGSEQVRHPKMISFEVFLNRKEEIQEADRQTYSSLAKQVQPDDLATIIYTSGTTGPPKGVLLTHRNFIENYLGSRQRIPVNQTDIALSLLPLSHVFERMAGYYYMMFHGVTIAYAENMQTVPENMLEVRPTIAAAVPRFYEKVYLTIQERVQKAPEWLKKIFHWAVSVGMELGERKLNKQAIPWWLGIRYQIADWLIFRKVRRGLGGRIKFFISGGAPLNPDLGMFFYAIGILILEGYGLTETSPVIACNSISDVCFGTVGKPLRNIEVKISEDGEILTRGACVMKGYYKNDEANQKVFEGGWFHTGDLGLIDERGFLKITGRKKDIIVTSSGKNIAPQNIEQLIMGDPLFQQVVLIGDQKSYLVALIVPNSVEVLSYAEKKGMPFQPFEVLLGNIEIRQWISNQLKKRIEDLARYEQIKYFALLPKEFSQDEGEVTPTLKIRRAIIVEKYRDLIEELYQGGARRISC